MKEPTDLSLHRYAGLDLEACGKNGDTATGALLHAIAKSCNRTDWRCHFTHGARLTPAEGGQGTWLRLGSLENVFEVGSPLGANRDQLPALLSQFVEVLMVHRVISLGEHLVICPPFLARIGVEHQVFPLLHGSDPPPLSSCPADPATV